VDFTREPIIETVITPKEGCKLVVRSSKSTGQEEHFVDALEVVSFGHSFFFRSLERPKTFLVPATDYEILEVREARMVLKNVGIDRAIKIGGGREGQMRAPKEPVIEKVGEEPSEEEEGAVAQEKSQEGRLDKKRDRRRNYRRRRGREGVSEEESQEGADISAPKIELQPPHKGLEGEEGSPLAQQVLTTSILTSLLPPPPTLISDTIGRYKENVLFKDAFYTKEAKEASSEESLASEEGEGIPAIPQPEYGSFEMTEEEEEEIYQQRKQQNRRSDEEAGNGDKEKESHQEHSEEKEANGLSNDPY
jgi:hypothetical protein